MANGKVLKGPYWTRNWIEAMWRFTNENFVDFDTGAVDYEALGKEEFQFRKALFFRNFKNSERAKMAFASAEDDYKNPVENGKKGGRPKKSPQDAPNGNAGVDMYDAGNGAASKSPTSCDQFTADGDIREDSQAKPDGSAITRNETRAHDALEPSANLYGPRQAKNGDAATREGADASTTVSRKLGEDAHARKDGEYRKSSTSSPTATLDMPAHDKDKQAPDGECNTASAQPDARPESGKPLATTPTPIRTDEALESQARQSRGIGEDSLRGKSAPAGRHCPANSPVPSRAAKKPYGTGALVMLTDSQAKELRDYYGEDFDRAVGILENYILSLPSKAEGDEKGDSKYWREDYVKRSYFAMRRDNWVDSALKRAKTEDARLEKATNTPKSFKQMDADDRTEFFSKSIFDGKEAI